MARIVVLGSSNTDLIISTATIPRPGETVIGGSFSSAGGGKGANQAVAAARAGGEVVFVARVGNDAFGDASLAAFVRDGIDVSRVSRDPQAASGVAFIIVDSAGENSIAVASGANSNLSPQDAVAAADDIRGADILLMQLEIPLETVRTAATIAFDAGVPVILNPAPACRLDNDLLGKIAILTPNESEASSLTGRAVEDDSGAAAAASQLRSRGIGSVLITLGARGVFVDSPEFRGRIPAFPVTPLDTTAAGDVFNGVLAVELAAGVPLTEAVRTACAGAALSVTLPGAQPSAPPRGAIHAFLRRFDGLQ